IGEGELMAHDVPLGCAPDEYDDLISGTCSHLPFHKTDFPFRCHFSFSLISKATKNGEPNHVYDECFNLPAAERISLETTRDTYSG
ncbi:hypothetical protein ACRWU2_16195, partial [Escherichia coli]